MQTTRPVRPDPTDRTPRVTATPRRRPAPREPVPAPTERSGMLPPRSRSPDLPRPIRARVRASRTVATAIGARARTGSMWPVRVCPISLIVSAFIRPGQKQRPPRATGSARIPATTKVSRRRPSEFVALQKLNRRRSCRARSATWSGRAPRYPGPQGGIDLISDGRGSSGTSGRGRALVDSLTGSTVKRMPGTLTRTTRQPSEPPC